MTNQVQEALEELEKAKECLVEALSFITKTTVVQAGGYAHSSLLTVLFKIEAIEQLLTPETEETNEQPKSNPVG